MNLDISVQAQVDEQLAGLQTLTAARLSKLEESIKIHQYVRDVEEVVSWVREKETVASSDDYGKDFDHLLVIFPIMTLTQNCMCIRTYIEQCACRIVEEGFSACSCVCLIVGEGEDRLWVRGN